jgi:hypothetical protein
MPEGCRDMRKWSLEARQGRLQALVSRIDCLAVLVSDPSKTARHSRAAWVGRRREQAAIGALPLRRMSRLAQGQNGDLARGQPGMLASTICRRNSGGYGARVLPLLGIVDSFDTNPRVSTKPGQLQSGFGNSITFVFGCILNFPFEKWSIRLC